MSKLNITSMRQPTGRKTVSQGQSGEYIKNLQQQIYLLELETRYMKAGKKGNGPPGGKSSYYASSASLGGAKSGSIHALNSGDDYDQNEEESEIDRTIAALRESEGKLKAQVEELKAANAEQIEAQKAQIEKHTTEKDQIHGETILARQKQEEALNESSHLKLSYERVVQEKELLEQQIVQAKGDVNSYKAKIDEQLAIHIHTRNALEKAQAQNHAQQERIKELESQFEDLNLDFYKKQITEQQYKLASVTAELKSESLEKASIQHHQDQLKENMKLSTQKHSLLEQEITQLKQHAEREQQQVKQRRSRNAEEARQEQDLIEQKVQMENEIKMLNISCESKNILIEELNQKIKTIEIAQLKGAEQAHAKKEKLDQLELLARNRAHELIQVGQDKSLLQDELADAHNHKARNDQRVKTLQAQNKALEAKLEQYQKESEEWKEFSSLREKLLESCGGKMKSKNNLNE